MSVLVNQNVISPQSCTEWRELQKYLICRGLSWWLTTTVGNPHLKSPTECKFETQLSKRVRTHLGNNSLLPINEREDLRAKENYFSLPQIRNMSEEKWPTELSIKIFMKRISSKRLIIINAVLDVCVYGTLRRNVLRPRRCEIFKLNNEFRESKWDRRCKAKIILLAS